MAGLSPEHHGLLNSLGGKTKRAWPVYDRLREEYRGRGDPLAIEEIDAYDERTPRFKHFVRLRDALLEGNGPLHVKRKHGLPNITL